LPWGRDVEPLIVISQILTGEAPALRTLAPSVPPHVEATIHKALAKSASDRFPLMDDIVRILDPQTSRTPVSLPKSVADSLGSAPTVASTRTSLASAPARPSPVPALARRKHRWIAPAVLALVVAVAGAVGFARRTHPLAPPPDAAAPAPTTLLDLPLPETSPEALAVYKDALRELRRGDGPVAIQRLKRALELDPQLAPALLRLARRMLSYQATEARELFLRATQQRASLTARDQELLHGFAPLFEHELGDVVEARRRLAALAQRYPLDAEIVAELARIDEQSDAFDAALAEFNRGFELDPEYAWALIGKADILFFQGDTAGAVAATRECDRVAPGVTSCQMLRTLIERREGRCVELEAEARKMNLVHPSASTGYVLAAEALAATGSPPGAVREAVSQARARMTESEKSFPENAILETNALIQQGAFGDAKALLLAREAAPLVKESAEEIEHATLAWARVQLALETGHEAEATDIAADFRGRSRAWSLPPDADSWIWRDARLPMLALLVREHRVSPDELEAARAAMTKSMSNPRDPVLWFGAYAWPATTASEATVALEALSRFEPLRSIWEFPAEYAIGRVYLLAGRVDDAVAHLVRAANACDALENPFDHVRASLLLGQALEAKRDVAGACKAYQSVVSQWGNAKPRSVTGSAARARLGALRCP
jgi:tetratricopeptide (TPR) repeat protein